MQVCFKEVARLIFTTRFEHWGIAAFWKNWPKAVGLLWGALAVKADVHQNGKS
jgi:hypothetical protein